MPPSTEKATNKNSRRCLKHKAKVNISQLAPKLMTVQREKGEKVVGGKKGKKKKRKVKVPQHKT